MPADPVYASPESSAVLVHEEVPEPPGRDDEGNLQIFRGSRLFNRIAVVFFGAQFIGLTAYSWVMYHRFDLGIDFATMDQAATEITRGNLNPYSTIVGSLYVDNHFGLIL